MTTETQEYVSSVIPGCRWDYRRFLRADRAARIAEANRDTIITRLQNGGFTLEWAARNSAEYMTAVRDARDKRARASRRREQLVACLRRMQRPDVVGDPEAYIDSRPETGEPAADPDTHEINPVPLPPGVTEDEDDADLPPGFAERCGARSKNFARYGYCDRPAAQDGGYCYSHA